MRGCHVTALAEQQVVLESCSQRGMACQCAGIWGRWSERPAWPAVPLCMDTYVPMASYRRPPLASGGSGLQEGRAPALLDQLPVVSVAVGQRVEYPRGLLIEALRGATLLT